MQAILLALGVFIIGIVLAVAIKKMNAGDSATFIALLLTPLLVYGIASGKVQEFTAPGGWGAKFREVAQEPVTPVGLLQLSQAIQQFDIIEKGGLDALAGLGTRLQKGKPIALTFQLGQRYAVDAAIKYVEFLLLTDNEMSVLITDPDKRFVAMTEGTTMLTLLRAPNIGQQVISSLANNNRDYFVTLPGFHANSIKATDTNTVALEQMRAQNARAIVVVDNDNRPTGVVKRDDIVARLLEKLATPEKS